MLPPSHNDVEWSPWTGIRARDGTAQKHRRGDEKVPTTTMAFGASATELTANAAIVCKQKVSKIAETETETEIVYLSL